MTRGLIVKFFLFTVTIIFLAEATYGVRDVRYVTDTHHFKLRSSISKPYKVVGTVESREVLTVLKEQDNYILVETSDGKKGWLEKQFTKENHPKSALITKYKKESNDLQASINILEVMLTKEKGRYGNLLTEEESQVFLNKNTELLRLNQELGNQLTQHQMEIAHLKSQLDFTQKQQQILWFIAGAALLFAGVLAGRWLNSKKKRYLY